MPPARQGEARVADEAGLRLVVGDPQRPGGHLGAALDRRRQAEIDGLDRRHLDVKIDAVEHRP